MAVINKDIAYIALPLSIRRGNPFPIDEYSVWYDMEELTTYAQSSPVAYVGQVVTLVNEEENTVEAYMIQNAAGNLMKLASTTASGDLTEDVLELQGKVSALETSVGTKEEESSITASNLWAAIEEVKAAYEAADSSINGKFNDYYNKTEADSKIDQKIATAISSTYKPAGSIMFSFLPTLGADQEGKVYNIIDAFTTTEDFVEGADNKYPAGTNVVCIDTDDAGTYKWDVLAGFVDLSGYETTSSVDTKLANKVDKVEGSSLVQDTLIAKLQGLAEIKGVSDELEIDPDDKTLGVKAIAQEKITGLPAALAEKIKSITVGTTPLQVSDGAVTIPIATAEALGVVKSTNGENGVAITGDGTMIVNNINIEKITQTPGTELILNGGDATVSG